MLDVFGRRDYAIISELIEPGTRVLDLGCGEGELLAWLRDHKNVDGRGVELTGASVQKAIARGVSVYQGDLESGLDDYPEQAFDYVILSQTLQQTRDPLKVLKGMLRIGKRGIVAFPNFGHWRVRVSHLVTGRSPQTKLFPYDWHNSPNIHFLTVLDFEALAEKQNWRVERRIFLAGSREVDHGAEPDVGGRGVFVHGGLSKSVRMLTHGGSEEQRNRLCVRLNYRDFEFLAQHFHQLLAVDGVGQGELHERFEVAGEVADVVAALLGRELHCVDPQARGAHALDGVGELNFPALVGFHASNLIENTRRKNVASGDGQAAGSFFGTRLFHQMRDPDRIFFEIGRRDDTVLSGFRERDFLDGDDAGGGILLEHLDHARDGVGLGMQAEDRIAQSHDKRIVPGEMLTRKDRVAQAFGRALASVEKLCIAGFEVEMILNRRLVAAGDEQDLLDAVGRQLVDDVFDDRFSRHRQHFLGLRTGGGQKSGAESGNGNNSASNHNFPLLFRIHEWPFFFIARSLKPGERLDPLSANANQRV